MQGSTTYPSTRSAFTFVVKREVRAEEVERGPEDGIYISGLFLQGARWDGEEGTLVDSKAKELFISFPIIHLLPSVKKVVAREGRLGMCTGVRCTRR